MLTMAVESNFVESEYIWSLSDSFDWLEVWVHISDA